LLMQHSSLCAVLTTKAFPPIALGLTQHLDRKCAIPCRRIQNICAYSGQGPWAIHRILLQYPRSITLFISLHSATAFVPRIENASEFIAVGPGVHLVH